MMGPMTYAQHLISTPRLPFTAAYFGSIALTLYFSLGVSIPSIPRTSPYSFINKSRVAWECSPYSDCMLSPISMLSLVFGQLLPNGIKRFAACDNLRSSEGSRMDDWIIVCHWDVDEFR